MSKEALNPTDIGSSTFVVNIPAERVGVLVGQGGSIKRDIQSRLGVNLTIDRDGVVAVSLSKSPEGGADPAALFLARDVVTAIGRGFSPERGLKLLDENMTFSLIDISAHVGRDTGNLNRVRARLIGTQGKTRRILEETTHTLISVYGDTVGIIGEMEDLQAAQEAVIKLIAGSPHSVVYRQLDQYSQRRKIGRLIPAREASKRLVKNKY